MRSEVVGTTKTFPFSVDKLFILLFNESNSTTPYHRLTLQLSFDDLEKRTTDRCHSKEALRALYISLSILRIERTR